MRIFTNKVIKTEFSDNSFIEIKLTGNREAIDFVYNILHAIINKLKKQKVKK